MSAIPPDIAGSSLQAGFVQREAARNADAARTAQAHASESQARAVDKAASNVETDDDDAQVYADAEGAGGQGRTFGDQPGEETDGAEDMNPSPNPCDGPMHLDIQA